MEDSPASLCGVNNSTKTKECLDEQEDISTQLSNEDA